MSSSGTIEELVDRFVAGILEVIQEARGEQRAAALAVVESMLSERGPSSGRRSPREAEARADHAPHAAHAPSRKSPRQPRQAAKPAAAPRRGHAARAHAAPAHASAHTPALDAGPAAAPAPESEPAAEPTLRHPREVLVLDAVRSLGRGTAAEIARQGGLPNGTVYVVLRSLVARGQVAKAETARGLEYRIAV